MLRLVTKVSEIGIIQSKPKLKEELQGIAGQEREDGGACGVHPFKNMPEKRAIAKGLQRALSTK